MSCYATAFAENTNLLVVKCQDTLLRYARHWLILFVAFYSCFLSRLIKCLLEFRNWFCCGDCFKCFVYLQNLRKHCDVVEVLQAHEIMRNVAQHIDQVKRNLEQQSRVRELSGILDGWLGPELTVLGDLVLEGMLTENGKPRTVLLFETMLIITKKKEDNRLQFKTYINVSVPLRRRCTNFNKCYLISV